MVFFSIITPIYNRSYFIDKIYQSLANQTYNNLEWIIVDDGSSDNLKEKVDLWNDDFVKYYRINNSGKHIAVNYGIDLAKGDYSIVLDSDDIPKQNAFEIFNKNILESKNQISGIGCLIEDSKKRLIGSKFNFNEEISILDAYSVKNMKGDKWFLFKTNIFKENKNPIISEENFLTEGVFHNRISRKKIKIKFINEILLTAYYNSDGYTSRKISLKKNNPLGYLLYYFENIISKELKINKYYFFNIINLFSLILLKSKKPIILLIMLILAIPVSILKYLIDIIKLKLKK